jgi:hypothetical protein
VAPAKSVEEHRDERHHGDAEDDVLDQERLIGEDVHVDQG